MDIQVIPTLKLQTLINWHMNPSILQMMNYYGFQAGLPSYILPWGIYVNKELASDNSITVPGPNWTIEEYTDFQGNKVNNEWYGSMDTPIRIIETGVNTLFKQLFEYNGTGDYVDLNSSEMQSMIPYIDEWNRKRNKCALLYNELLSDIEGVEIPLTRPECSHIFHLYVIRVTKRDELQAFLKQEGISTGIHYPKPLPFLKAYERFGYMKNDFPYAYQCQNEILSLPMFPELTPCQIEYVADKIKSFMS